MSALSSLRTLLGVVMIDLLALAWLPDAQAQIPEVVHVKVGKVATVQLPRQLQRLSTEDAAIATVEVLPDGRISVTGRKAGETRIVGRDQAQVPIIIRVKVSD